MTSEVQSIVDKAAACGNNRRLGVVSPALAHPRTGKSISVSVAIALRACVRASEAACAR